MIAPAANFRILGCYSTVHRIPRDATSLPPLTETVAKLCGSRVRRVDRYIELCLMGALTCAEGCDLPEDTAIYLATGNGTTCSPVQVMGSIFAQHQPPKPLHFVNTLGNTACFYLTRALATKGQTLVVSQEALSFEAALFQACMDLSAGVTTAALVGGIDEVVLPFAHQALRAGAPAAEALLEGSHWLLLSKRQNEGVHLSTPLWVAQLEDALPFLQQHESRTIVTAFELTNRDRHTLQEAGLQVAEASAASRYDAHPHPVYSAATLVENIDKHEGGVHISRGENGFCVVASGSV